MLWDLDGTIVDSEEYHWLAWRDTMRGEGVELTYEQFLGSFGQRNDGILGAWLGALVDPGRMHRVGETKEAEFRRLAAAHGMQPLPGAREWLSALHAAGWKQSIASSAPRENVEALLRVLDLAPYLDAIAAAEDVTVGKPDPQIFLSAAARLGVPPNRCIVVEDVPAGIEGAKRGGMKSIGVSRNAVLNADVFVRSLLDLPADAFDRLIP